MASFSDIHRFALQGLGQPATAQLISLQIRRLQLPWFVLCVQTSVDLGFRV